VGDITVLPGIIHRDQGYTTIHLNSILRVEVVPFHAFRCDVVMEYVCSPAEPKGIEPRRSSSIRDVSGARSEQAARVSFPSMQCESPTTFVPYQTPPGNPIVLFKIPNCPHIRAKVVEDVGSMVEQVWIDRVELK